MTDAQRLTQYVAVNFIRRLNSRFNGKVQVKVTVRRNACTTVKRA
jgi:hypothetical protein